MKPTVFTSFVALAALLLAGASLAADLPPDESGAKAALEKSPRHGEMIDVTVPGAKVPLRSYVVYPERKEKAPVVIVIHEIFGLSDWVRGITDQLAAEGFIAIAPDMLSGHGKDGGGTESFAGRDDVMKAIRGLKTDEVTADLNAVRDYATKQPSASGKSATIGFCWGGGHSFTYAAHQPGLDAAVVYYGMPPAADDLAKIKCPVMGNYGEIDLRIAATVEPTAAAMKKLDVSYSPHVYTGAGHGFLRAQDGQNGANLKATKEAWPATVQFLREHTK